MSTSAPFRFSRKSVCGDLARTIDWASTPLGPAASWPRSLHVYVDLVMDLPTGAILFWGDDLVQIYNDGYSLIMGPRHPRYFAATYRDCWPDTYPHIIPLMRRVLGGESIALEKAFFAVTRHGFYEEAYFTFTFSPIRDDEGVIRGIIQPIVEVTETVLAERRADTLRKLAPRIDSDDPLSDAVDALAENPKDVPFALVFLWNDDARDVVLSVATPNVALAGLDTTAFAVLARTAAEANAPIEIADASERLAGRAFGPWEAPARGLYVLPMRRSQADAPRGAVVFGLSSALPLDDRYRGFFQVVAGQMVSALDNKNALRDAERRAEALAELDRAKTVFFSNVSHELRTPLTLMLGPTEDALATPARALEGEALELVHRNELRLLKLVNTLLDFSRVEAGRIEATLQSVDLTQLTRELAETFRPAVERAGLALVVECEPLSRRVAVDASMYEKIVMNLLSNALKFTFEGEITLSLRKSEMGEGIELVVRDTGIGVPAAEVPNLFKRFHRVQNARSRTHEGTGIGLALVYELAKLHGGSARAESVEGRGTTFFVTLPLVEARAADDAPLAKTSVGVGSFVEEALRWSPDGREGGRLLADAHDVEQPVAHEASVTVLVADDNADMRGYVARLLRERYSVVTANDGETALRMALESPPDVIVSDIMMPGLDGFGLLSALRSDPKTRNIPVLLLSARAGEEAQVEGLEAGADDYLVKPFSARELYARVAARLEVRQLNQGLEKRVTERTAELLEANRELESFSYSVSHDLRAPLRHIVGFAQMLEKGLPADLDEKSRARLKTIRPAAERGGELVDDLLSFSRLGRADLVKRPVSLSALARDVREELAPEMAGRQVQWKIAPLPDVEGDSSLLRLVLKNLLGNALKYSRSRTPAVIDVAAIDHGNTVEIIVTDNGVGFDMAYADKLFGVFQRLHSSSEFEGNGIGLALVRRVIARHGGKTWASGAPGKGASFHFTLSKSKR